MNAINWQSLAEMFENNDCFDSDAIGGVFDLILGESVIGDAVNACVIMSPGWQIAESFLQRIRSPFATRLCAAAAVRDDKSADVAARLLAIIGDKTIYSMVENIALSSSPSVRQAALAILERKSNDVPLVPEDIDVISRLSEDADYWVSNSAVRLMKKVT